MRADDGFCISMFDIVSLYPFINAYSEYPVGIPQIIVPESPNTPLDTEWTRLKKICN
jgi:hypothetical protein